MRVHEVEGPDSAITRIADEMLAAAERSADDEGATLSKAVVLVHIDGEPEGEDDSCVASAGLEDTEQLFEVLLNHARAVAASLGKEMIAMPLFGPEDKNVG